MTMTRRAGAIAAALAAAAALSSPAFSAEPGTMTDYVKVNRAAVTPASPAEARRSLVRLGAAAMEVCGASFFSVPGQQDAVRRSPCFRESMSNVVARINNPYLTAAYQQRRGTVEVADGQGGAATHAR